MKPKRKQSVRWMTSRLRRLRCEPQLSKRQSERINQLQRLLAKPEAADAVCNLLIEARQERNELLAALRILTDPVKQLEHTPGDYFIFRLSRADMEKIASAIAKAERGAQ